MWHGEWHRDDTWHFPSYTNCQRSTTRWTQQLPIWKHTIICMCTYLCMISLRSQPVYGSASAVCIYFVYMYLVLQCIVLLYAFVNLLLLSLGWLWVPLGSLWGSFGPLWKVLACNGGGSAWSGQGHLICFWQNRTSHSELMSFKSADCAEKMASRC